MFLTKRDLLFLIVQLLLVPNAVAQYTFVNYDYTNGLPIDEIVVIREDSLGYIWMGGPSGLVKFDGHHFTHYFRGKPNTDVAGNIVNDIDVLPNGDVLVSYDDNGISIYDHATQSFRSRRYSLSDSDEFPQHSIFSSFVANDSIAYLCANREGLYRFNMNTFISERIDINAIPHDIAQDPKDIESLYYTIGGLHRLNTTSLSVDKLSDSGFGGIQILDGEVWFNGYSEYVYSYNPETNLQKPYPTKFPGVIRGWTHVDGRLWAGLAQGIEIIDTSTTEVVEVINSESAQHNFPGDFIYEIFKDSEGRVWISSNGGLSMYDPSVTDFEKTDLLPEESTYLTSIGDEEWLSLDFYNNKVRHIISGGAGIDLQIAGNLKAPVHTFYYQDQLFVTFFNGIGRYDRSNNSIAVLDCPFSQSSSRGLIEVLPKGDQLLAIYRYSNQMIAWQVDSDQRDTIALGGEPKGIVSTEDGLVWIYGANILWKYFPKTGSRTRVPLDSERLSQLAGDIVNIAKTDATYWISSRINGVWEATYANEMFYPKRAYDKDQGLTSNSVKHAYVDDEGNYYVLTRAGVFRYDESSDRFHQLTHSTNVKFQSVADLCVSDSIIYLLGRENFSLDLRNVNLEHDLPKIILKQILVNDQPIHNDFLRHQTLQCDENNIHIKFDVVYFGNAAEMQLRYRLYDEQDWTYPENNIDNIVLTSLAPEEYSIQIAASDGRGLWSLPVGYSFTISPPFWKTWWFIIWMFLCIAALYTLIYKWRIKHHKKLHMMEIKLAEIESESLRAQMNPHFIFNALNSIKSYIIKNEKEKAADYLTTFSELIRAVLRNSTDREISLQSELEALSLYLQIENLRLNEKFEYDIIIDQEVDASIVAIPPLIIQPFVENSIWHGFINKKSDCTLTVNVQRNRDQVVIIVQDNGIGREASRAIEKRRERKRSYGIAITKTRLLSLLESTDVQIEDLHEGSSSIGTRVVIRIPYKVLDTTIENQKVP